MPAAYLLRFKDGTGYLRRALFASGHVATRRPSHALQFPTEAAALEYMVRTRSGPLVEVVKAEEERK